MMMILITLQTEQAFWDSVLEHTSYENFVDVLNGIKITKQAPKVFRTLEDENVIVTLMNPINKAGETVSRAVDRNRNDENLLYKLNHQE